jgi:hypothetical protein
MMIRSGASFVVCRCVGRMKTVYSPDIFRLDEIRLDVDAPEPRRANEEKILPRFLKDL